MADDPLIGQLSKFTPYAAGLDRDTLLFAAGKASARPNRGWKVLAGALATAQLLTLGMFLLPAAVPPSLPETQMVAAPNNAQPSLDPTTFDPNPSGVWAWREYFIAEDGSLTPLSLTAPMMPDDPPLSAFGSSPWDLLN